ncbi:GtrA family protein [Patescibacteria group bacterium]|nr:MAG: GtrA family protein [Patescibacteria group bacterium]
MEAPTQTAITVNKKDYFLIAFIGFSFGLFSVPILKNIQLPFITLNVTTVLGIMVFFVLFAILALWIASLIAKKIPLVLQFAKFAAAGAFNSFLDWGVLNILIALTGIATGFGFSGFKGISFIVANISSYFWNKYWTFGSQDAGNMKTEAGKFFLVSVIGLAINIGMASLIVNGFHVQGMSPERWANIGALAATLISLIWNFFGYKLWVFKK